MDLPETLQKLASNTGQMVALRELSTDRANAQLDARRKFPALKPHFLAMRANYQPQAYVPSKPTARDLREYEQLDARGGAGD